MLVTARFARCMIIALVAFQPLAAQSTPAQRGGGPPAPPNPLALPLNGDSARHVRRTPPDDPVIQQMWIEGTKHSQAMMLAQRLTDSLGPRLTGSQDMDLAQYWLLQKYREWGVTAWREKYGTWNSWRRGIAHVDLILPRVRTLEANIMAWTPGTGNKWLEGEVVIIPSSVTTRQAFDAWLPSVRGKVVLTSPPRVSCRAERQWEEFAALESRAEYDTAQAQLTRSYQQRIESAGGANAISGALKAAGAQGVLTTNWSQYPGVNKIFGSPRQQLPTIDIGCEDYGLLYRLAENAQHPTVRFVVDAQFLGEWPVYNVIAEIKGTEKPDEYVLLSAHFDSWIGGSGATDNGTGSITMMEAMRIIKETYPRPKRTILVGHWSGEEQGLNGSRGWIEDHPEVVAGLQAAFNQDNGTGRVSSMGPGPFTGTRPVLERYLQQLPSEITQWIRLGSPAAGPATGGSDHAGFQCLKAPAFSLGALSWDYSNTTWHTNRDTYDKIVPYDLRNNAMLVAMLAYLASEDPSRMPRAVTEMPLDTITRAPRPWPACAKSVRESTSSTR